jgi:hypothetical protein
MLPKTTHEGKCTDCGKEVHFLFPLDLDSKEPLYCRACWKKTNPSVPNMEIVQRGHPHRRYGDKDETWPWGQSPYDPASHRTFGWQRPIED